MEKAVDTIIGENKSAATKNKTFYILFLLFVT